MTRTVAVRAKPTIRLRWENPRQKTVTLEHIIGNRVVASRTMRGRGLLSLPEAAAVVERPEAFLRAAIRDGELTAARRGRAPRVTLQAALKFRAADRRARQDVTEGLQDLKAGRVRVYGSMTEMNRALLGR